MAEAEFNARWERLGGPGVHHGVVGEGFGEGLAGCFGGVAKIDLYSFEKFVGVSAAAADVVAGASAEFADGDGFYGGRAMCHNGVSAVKGRG